MYLKYRKKKKIHEILTTSLKIWTLRLTKISYTNPPPTSMTTLISKTISPFCHKWQKIRVSSRHPISTGRVSIFILIINIVVKVIIVLGCLGRRRGRFHKATKASLSFGNTADTGVHLIQLSSECIKASIHTLKLCNDRIKSHTSRRRRGSGGGWSWRSGRSCRPGPPRT